MLKTVSEKLELATGLHVKQSIEDIDRSLDKRDAFESEAFQVIKSLRNSIMVMK